MDKKRMNFTLPPDICELLDKETNKSDTVAKSVRMYLTSRDASRRIIALADRLESKLPEQIINQPQPIQQEEIPHGYVDPNNRKRKWNAFIEGWEANE